ncbi:MAG: AraC family transcriptional regulator [Acholeplasmatales bacterium]|nr:MAG: AraC family transcriptional regulator [Acholeplasmatales bacterium]
MDFSLHYIGHRVIENSPFTIDRPEGSFRHLFFHFISPVIIETPKGLIEAEPGSSILYEPGVKQKFYVERNRLSHDYLDFTVQDPDFFSIIRYPLNTLINPRMSKNISETIERILLEINSNRVGNEYMISSMMTSLFTLLSRRIHNHSVGTNRVYQDELKVRFEALRLKMYHSPAESSVKAMAKSLDFSPAHFTNLYKKFFHVTPIEDLTKARIHLVPSLLAGNEPIDLVVRKLGLSSSEYFFRWFKQHFDMTPAEFRASLKPR